MNSVIVVLHVCRKVFFLTFVLLCCAIKTIYMSKILYFDNSMLQ